jgi:tripartite-type tricarboxylate transporter receptor subunit TctC
MSHGVRVLCHGLRVLCRGLLGLAIAALPGLRAAAADAPGYPQHPVRVLVGFPAGTSSDIIARVFTQQLAEHFSQQFLVENRVGASSNLAAQAAAHASADGYTLFLGTVANTIGQSLFTRLGVDMRFGFAPIAQVATAPNLLVVNPALGIRTVSGLISYTRSHPGEVFFGSAGTGTAPHMSGELFNMMAGVHMTHVPYKGNTQGLADLVEGQLSALFAPAPTVAPFIASGRLRAIALTSAARSALMPELPTLAESGLPGFDTSIWYGFFAPAGTPAPLVQTLADALLSAAARPAIRAELARYGAEPLSRGPAPFAAFLRDDISQWAKVVAFAGIRVED